MKSTVKKLILKMMSLCLFSCGNTVLPSQKYSTVESAHIINGKEMPTQNSFQAVFKMNMGGTATFLSKRVFLTVAHNFQGADPTSNLVMFGQNIKYFIHPKYGKTDEGEFDIAIGILEHDLIDQVTEQPVSICSLESPLSLVKQNTLFVGFGCNEVVYDTTHTIPIITKYEGMGIKRYGYSPISKIENDIVTTADPNGALSCPGDSGAPYLLINDKNEVCLLATNFTSDRKTTNKGTNVFFPEVRNWLESIIINENVEVCGINKICAGPIISQEMLPKK